MSNIRLTIAFWDYDRVRPLIDRTIKPHGIDLSPNAPKALGRPDSPVRRLFEDYRTVEKDYFAKTGIFPIMHTIVLRKDVYEKHPWAAASLFEAFEQLGLRFARIRPLISRLEDDERIGDVRRHRIGRHLGRSGF